MITLNEKRLGGLTLAAGVWLTGVAAAIAIAWGLTRPIKMPAVAWFEEPRGATEPALGAVLEESQVRDMLEVGQVWIFGEAARREQGAAEPQPTTEVRDIEQMQCTGWRDLEAGSGHVQICE